jgi:hypothetical protein
MLQVPPHQLSFCNTPGTSTSRHACSRGVQLMAGVWTLRRLRVAYQSYMRQVCAASVEKDSVM